MVIVSSKSPKDRVVGPLPNGLFMAYKWRLLTNYLRYLGAHPPSTPPKLTVSGRSKPVQTTEDRKPKSLKKAAFKQIKWIIQEWCWFGNLSIYLSIYLSIHLSIHPSIYPSIYLSIYRSFFLSFFLSSYLSIFLSFYLSIHLSFYGLRVLISG